MTAREGPSRFWVLWLFATLVGVMIFGLALVLAPGMTRHGFSCLIYADAARLNGFGADALAYIALMHAVLGCTMVGWGVALLGVVGTFCPWQPGRLGDSCCVDCRVVHSGYCIFAVVWLLAECGLESRVCSFPCGAACGHVSGLLSIPASGHRG